MQDQMRVLHLYKENVLANGLNLLQANHLWRDHSASAF
jgi:hypothetical protein